MKLRKHKIIAGSIHQFKFQSLSWNIHQSLETDLKKTKGGIFNCMIVQWSELKERNICGWVNNIKRRNFQRAAIAPFSWKLRRTVTLEDIGSTPDMKKKQ